MKTGTERLLKFRRLKARLGMSTWQAKGILDSIWDVCAECTPRGDLGRLSNADIAFSIEYSGDADALIQALVAEEWLDIYARDPVVRFVVHDWADHCPEYIKKRVYRSGKPFYTLNVRHAADNGRQNLDNGGITQPNPTQPNHTQPSPTRSGSEIEILPPNPSLPEDTGESAARERGNRDSAIGLGEFQPNGDGEPHGRTQTITDGHGGTHSASGAKDRGTPEALGIGGAICQAVEGLTAAEKRAKRRLWRRIEAIQPEGPWLEWWRELLGVLWEHGEALSALEEALKHVEDSMCERTRSAKGIGLATDPDKLLVKLATEVCRKHKLRWPKHPARRANVRM